MLNHLIVCFFFVAGIWDGIGVVGVGWGQVREHRWAIRAYCVVALASQRGEPYAVQGRVARKVSVLISGLCVVCVLIKPQGICRLCRRFGRATLFRVQLPRLNVSYSLRFLLPLRVLSHHNLKKHTRSHRFPRNQVRF